MPEKRCSWQQHYEYQAKVDGDQIAGWRDPHHTPR